MRSHTLNFNLTPVTARAYDFLKTRILAGILKPGEFLSAGKLSGEIGISRTPIKDAFRHLENDGLVSVAPRLGAIVTAFDERHLREMLGYRKALEIYAVEETARMRHANDLEEMDAVVRNIREQMTAQVEPAEVLGGSARFHQLIVSSARNFHITRRFDDLQQILEVYRRSAASSPETMETLSQDSLDFSRIVEAIRDNDGARARQVLGFHLDRSTERMLATFRDDQPVYEIETFSGVIY